MVYNKNNKGQAAIEFLMTYGWMLLVVLIVGALIFSFVDFGTLLPNKLELSNDLRGTATEMTAYAYDDNITVVFNYNGPQKITIVANRSILLSTISGNCTSTTVTNVDTGDSGVEGASVTFLNGQIGWMKFNCSAMDLLPNDVFEGKIKIETVNAKTGLSKISSGAIRVGIEE